MRACPAQTRADKGALEGVRFDIMPQISINRVCILSIYMYYINIIFHYIKIYFILYFFNIFFRLHMK